MRGRDEARVEVLTAEVRVLQVGPRQLTLNMVRQLDWVKPGDVKAFGRVKTGDLPPWQPQAPLSGKSVHIEIVGSVAGILVRSASWHTTLTCMIGVSGTECPEAQELSREANITRIAAPSNIWSSKYKEFMKAKEKVSAHRHHDWSRYEPDQQTYDVWKALPLILLADS
jgi:hypothetical protein